MSAAQVAVRTYPVPMVADVAIVSGALLLAFATVLHGEPDERERRGAA